jgi:conjugative transfer region lipoprotein (TIGR03751 family)
MRHRAIPTRPLFCALLVATLGAGCAATKDQVIPSDGPTMLEIYRDHERRNGVDQRPGAELRQPIAPARESAAGEGRLMPVAVPQSAARYAREEADVLNQRFARLPNPDLVMYVYPHLSASGAPVPGYVTVLPMYDTVEYALPGEVPPSAQRLAGGQ